MHVYKGMDGWRAKSSFPFGDGSQELEISTYKRSKGMVASIASVSRVSGGFKTFAVFSDFSKIMNQAVVPKITQDVIRKMHEETLNRIDGIKAEAEAFYKAKQEQEIAA